MIEVETSNWEFVIVNTQLALFINSPNTTCMFVKSCVVGYIYVQCIS